MDIYTVKKILKKEEVDYQSLLSCLQAYASPRSKISHWLKKGDLIRVKKGLYVFGKHLSEHPYSIPLLANLIYGPSALSLEYALSYYGFIPERVVRIMSVTPKRNKQFETPIGLFSYRYLPLEKYRVGIRWLEVEPGMHCFVASPEKALCDVIYFNDFGDFFDSVATVQAWLLEDLRAYPNMLEKLSRVKLQQLGRVYNHPSIHDFVRYFSKEA